MSNNSLKETAAVALSLLDLTNLKDDCTEAQIEALCARAQTPYGNTAAICIWPRFVAHARAILGSGHPVRIATVVNFPIRRHGDRRRRGRNARGDCRWCRRDRPGYPYRKFIAGSGRAVTDMVAAVRTECADKALLKVILETGEIKEAAMIRRASELAIEAGADFIKTSTGKVAVNATLEAADIMLRAIRQSGRKVGFKPAGGIATVAMQRSISALPRRS
jgi:deoxyribose-phosphate aldolase